MAERASIYQVVQLGIESTAGTAVAATKRLAAADLSMGPRVDVSEFRPSGYKFASVTALNREWAEGTATGPITYNELIYWLSGVLLTATPTGTTAKTWSFTPDTDAADTKKTFTIEHGSSVRAQRYAYGLVTGLGLSFSRTGAEYTASILAQAMEDGHTLTGSLSGATPIPVVPPDVQVYVADTAAGLSGASALARVLSVEWNIGDRFGPVWSLNGSTDFAADVETEPSLEVKVLMEADAAGMGLLTNLRASSSKFVRIEAINSTELETDIYYTLTIDTAGQVVDVSDFSDEDGVYAIEWTLRGVHDATWGKATQVDVINLAASL